MKTRLITVGCIVAAIGCVGAFAYAFNDRTSRKDQILAPFEFRLEPALTPEIAAQSMFLGVATSSPIDFVQHVLVGVCENEIDMLQNFAESLHATKFSHDGEAFTYYDLCDQQRMIHRKKPLRVIASAAFDTSDPKVELLKLEAPCSYGGNRFVAVDIAGQDYQGLEYHSRIVVTQVRDGWYAIPRRRGSKSFYEIADAMSLAPTEGKEAK